MQRKRIPRRFWRKFTKLNIYNYIPDKMAVKIKYRNHFLKKLDLKNPVTFNEKLQWLKLYNRRPEYTTMVDKLAVKKYVADQIGEEYIVPTIGVWDSFDEIDFEKLPNQFVLKCTHGSGDTVICKDKSLFDMAAAKRTLEESLHTDYYLISREWPYKNVPRKIIAEEYIEDVETGEARDYKFFCFGGNVKALFVATERSTDTKFDFFDTQFNHLPIINGHPNANCEIKKPDRFDEMIQISEELSKGIPHVRVDLYEINHRIYFGELTFFHYSGLVPFEPMEWDETFGKWLVLPETKLK